MATNSYQEDTGQTIADVARESAASNSKSPEDASQSVANVEMESATSIPQEAGQVLLT